MAWRTADYGCEHCGAQTEDYLGQAPLPDTLPCTCGQLQQRRFGAPMVLKASFPDGSGRFNHMREQRKLRREERRAVRTRNKEDMRRIGEEKRKLGSHIRTDKGPDT